jgi:hypothetical protein
MNIALLNIPVVDTLVRDGKLPYLRQDKAAHILKIIQISKQLKYKNINRKQ